MIRLVLTLGLLTGTVLLDARQHLLPAAVFSAIAAEFSGERTHEHVRNIVLFHRIQASPMMTDAAESVLKTLEQSGVEAALEEFPADGVQRYSTFTSPMGWNIASGELWIEGAAVDGFTPIRLCRFEDVPMCVSSYSKGGDWSGELVDVGAGTSPRDYQGHDVAGKVVLASGSAGTVVRQGVIARGAVGAVIYPDASDRPSHPNMVRFGSIGTRPDELEKSSGSFQISTNQYAHLKSLMRAGPVRVRGRIEATLGPGRLAVVHAWIRGTDPRREVLVTAHLDHPKWSANDNATGTAMMLEMARTIRALVTSRTIAIPRHSIHFMWVPEFQGTVAYFERHPEVRSCHVSSDPRPVPSDRPVTCVLANLNLDMVGEDLRKTDSRFYVTRTPDSVPSALNALLEDVLEQTAEADLVAPSGSRNTWHTIVRPYVQGSDHDVTLGLGIPSSMLGHDPDWTHHTSEDTVDKTDATELLRVGVLATGASLWLATASEDEWRDAERRELASRVGTLAGRIAKNDARTDSAARIRSARARTELASASRALLESHSAPLPEHEPNTTATTPRRRTLLPLAGAAFAGVSDRDRNWIERERSRFPAGGGVDRLPTMPTFDLLVFGAINLMNGRRPTSEIAVLLASEHDLDIDQAWVDRLVEILATLKLVHP